MTCLGNFLLFSFLKLILLYATSTIANDDWGVLKEWRFSFLSIFIVVASSFPFSRLLQHVCLVILVHECVIKIFHWFSTCIFFFVSLSETKLLFLSVFMLKKDFLYVMLSFYFIYIILLCIHYMYVKFFLSQMVLQRKNTVFCREVNRSTISLNIADFYIFLLLFFFCAFMFWRKWNFILILPQFNFHSTFFHQFILSNGLWDFEW